MPLYKYKVSDSSGKVLEQLIKAENQADSLMKVRGQGFTPIKCFGQIDDYSGGGLNLLKKDNFDIYDFTDRLLPLLEAHIPLERAFGILSEGSENEKDSFVIHEIRRGLHEGKKFSALIREYDKYFPKIYASLIEAGEESGALIEVVKELQRYLNEKKELKNFLITNSIYPGIILLVVSVVVVAMFFFFIPKFAETITGMGNELPLITQIMLDASAFFLYFWWLWISMIVGIIYFIVLVKRGGKAKTLWDEKILQLPLLGPIIQTLEISKFVRTTAILVQNHVHLLQTVSIASKVINNRTIADSLASVATELRNGAKLSNAFSKSIYIPKLALQMLRIGEESGNLGEMLIDVANDFEKKLKLKIERILSFFEPVLILFMASVVTVVVLSVFLAILEMDEI